MSKALGIRLYLKKDYSENGQKQARGAVLGDKAFARAEEKGVITTSAGIMPRFEKTQSNQHYWPKYNYTCN